MIKRIKEKDYKFKHPLGNVIIDEVDIGVSDKSGRRSISIQEIERMTKIAVEIFISRNLEKSIKKFDYSLSQKHARAIMEFLKVTQTEYADLLGCQKGKVSKIFSGDQKMSRSQSQLAIQRLKDELEHGGYYRGLFDGKSVSNA